MNIQYVRLNEDVCEILNDMARDGRQTVSDLVNQILREYLRRPQETAAARAAE